MGAAQAFEHSQSAEPFPSCVETYAGDWLARREAEQTLATNPKDAEAHYVMGMVKLRTHNPADAQVEAELALQAAPDFFLARLLQSEVLMFTKSVSPPAHQDAAGRSDRECDESCQQNQIHPSHYRWPAGLNRGRAGIYFSHILAAAEGEIPSGDTAPQQSCNSSQPE